MDQIFFNGTYSGDSAVLLDGVSAVTDGTSLKVGPCQGSTYHILMTGTAVASIEGSIDGGTSWYELGRSTADLMFGVAYRLSHVRARVTSYTSGTVTVKFLGWR